MENDGVYLKLPELNPIAINNSSELQNHGWFTKNNIITKISKYWLLILFFLILIPITITLANNYLKMLLISLEYTSVQYNFLIFLFLFIIVSFPMTWGYILLNLTAGYLFGAFFGLVVITSCAFSGISIAHFTIRYILPHSFSLTDSRKMKTLVRLVEGTEGFKFIALTRLTPIPFGIQNTFFAMCRLSYSRYVLASMAGMLPTQGLHVAIGSTLRSMQDVVSSNSSTYLVLFSHFLFLLLLFLYIAARAQKEFKRTVASSYNELPIVHNL